MTTEENGFSKKAWEYDASRKPCSKHCLVIAYGGCLLSIGMLVLLAALSINQNEVCSTLINATLGENHSLYGPALKQWFYTYMKGMVPLTMDIAKGSSIPEHMCYACIAHLDINTSEQEEREKCSLIDGCL